MRLSCDFAAIYSNSQLKKCNKKSAIMSPGVDIKAPSDTT